MLGHWPYIDWEGNKPQGSKMAKYFNTRAAADFAARRELKVRFGKSYMPKATIDFTVSRSSYGANYGMWTFDLMI